MVFATVVVTAGAGGDALLAVSFAAAQVSIGLTGS
jgi:hypothetical protein